MPFAANVLKVLIASPSDVSDERNLITERINYWNAINTEHYKIVLLPIKWETHSTPELGNRAQGILNEQFVDDCDMVIGVFWTRIGTHTGVAISGTVEEIERLRDKGKRVMLYFSSAKIDPDKLDLKQYQKLKQYKTSLYKQGLLEEYHSLEELKEKLDRQLTLINRNSLPTNPDENKTFSLENIEKEWNLHKELTKSIKQAQEVLTQIYDFLIQEISKKDGTLNEKYKEIAKSLKKLIDSPLFEKESSLKDRFWYLGSSLIDELKEIIFVYEKQ